MTHGWFDEFEHGDLDVDGTSVSCRFGGRPDGPTLMLVHGSPQTHVIWRRVAEQLKDDYFLHLPDLRG
jgi:haloacetate dehalogenase